jgi:hypothetical protein
VSLTTFRNGTTPWLRRWCPDVAAEGAHIGPVAPSPGEPRQERVFLERLVDAEVVETVVGSSSTAASGASRLKSVGVELMKSKVERL